MMLVNIPNSGSVTNQRKPFSRVAKSRRVRELGYNFIGIMGLMAVVLTFATLFVVNPLDDFVLWVDLFALWVSMLLLTGVFLKYVSK